MSAWMKRMFSMAAAVALAVLLLPGTGEAQDAPPQQPPGQQPQSLPDAPDRDELERFTEAMLDVQEIQEGVQGDLAAAQDPDEMAAIQQEASLEVEESLEEYDLTLERYSEIGMVVDADQEVHMEFQEVLEEALEERGESPQSPI